MPKQICFPVRALLLLSLWLMTSSLPGATGPASDLALEIIDSATGQAIRPDRITVLNPASGVVAQVLEKEQLSTQGRAVLSVPPGRHQLAVSAAGHHPMSGFIDPSAGSGFRYRFLLDPENPPAELDPDHIAQLLRTDAMLIQGFVTDSATGQPLADVNVSSGSGANTRSDAAGFFRFYEPVDAGSEPSSQGLLRFDYPGFQTQEYRQVELWPGGDWTYRVRLNPGSGLEVFNESESRRRAPEVKTQNNLKSADRSVLAPPLDLDGPSISSTALTNSTVRVPRQIRVLLSDGVTIDYVSMNYYARAVLASEWIPSWGSYTGGSNSLNAGAIAVRCYAIAKINGVTASSLYDICATTSCQVYKPANINSLTDRAVNFTENYVVVNSSGTIPSTEYSAENNQLGQSCGDGFTAPTSGCLYDPACAGETEYGHGRGMCQWGTARWATGRRMAGRSSGDATPNGYPRRDWIWLVRHYYPSYTLVKGQPLVAGDDIKPLKTVEVRACAGGSISNGMDCPLIKSQTTSARGVILSGPTLVTNDTSKAGFTWYQVQWTDGTTGWSQENFLERVFSAPANTPATPVVASLSTNRIQLNWTDNNSAETGYAIERALSASGPWYNVAVLPQNTTSYADQSLLPGNTYYYRLAAFNPAGSSPYSPVASASTLGIAPSIVPVPSLATTAGIPIAFNISATAPDFQQMLVDFEAFLTETANGVVLFRTPRFSGSTSSHLDLFPDLAAVTDTFPGGHGTGLVLRVSCNFTNPNNPWLRLTTSGTANWPNPVIDLNRKFTFDVWTDKPIRVGLGVRETTTASGTTPGSDGGTTGGIEWVGITGVSGSAPIPSRLVSASNWTRLSFVFTNEPVRSFSSGNGVLATASKLAVLEHLAVVPVQTGLHSIFLDNFSLVAERRLSFSLGAANPSGSAIDPEAGRFTWIPGAPQIGDHTLSVIVAANSGVPLKATNTFSIAVHAAPTLTASTSAPGTIRFAWNGVPGTRYKIQYCLDVANPVWLDADQVIATGTEASLVQTLDDAPRFYRVVIETTQ